MAARAKPPFRADHVGSLLRPPELLQARADHAAGRISAAELRRHEDDAIRKTVKMQEDIGLQGVTDGEARRIDWVMDFKYGLGGVRKLGTRRGVPFQVEGGTVEWTFEEYLVDARLRLDHVIFGEDFSFLKSVAKATPKLSIPSPSMMHYPAGRGIDRTVYPDDAELFADLAKVYAAEIAALGKLGCTYLQLDDTSLAFLNDPARRGAAGPGAETLHRRYIQLFNAAIANRPAGMTICTHLCRGNFRSAWAGAGGYDHVADALFNELDVDGFFLEFDDARSGGFEPLRHVPKGKTVVLGLVTTKKGALESKDELKRRIDAASKFVPLDQLCLSPQCGFASTAEGNMLSIDEEIAKLRLVVDTAREVWGIMMVQGRSRDTHGAQMYPIRADWLALRDDEEALEPGLPIIDPHHHLWDRDGARYLLDELLDDVETGHDIRSTVFIQCRSMYRADGPVELQPLGEVEFVNGVAAMSASGSYGDVRACAGIVGHADLRLGARVRDVLEAERTASSRFCGIRFSTPWDETVKLTPQAPPRHIMQDAAWREGFAQLAPLGLTFDALLFHTQLDELIDLARAFPQTTIVLDHVGCVIGIGPYAGKRDEIFAEWRKAMLGLGRCENVFVKLGGLAMPMFGFGFEQQSLPPLSDTLASAWRPYIETSIEAFGPRRAMFESNFPVDKVTCSYKVIWNTFKRLAAGYSADETAALFHGAAARAYRLADV